MFTFLKQQQYKIYSKNNTNISIFPKRKKMNRRTLSSSLLWCFFPELAHGHFPDLLRPNTPPKPGVQWVSPLDSKVEWNDGCL